MVPRLDIRIDGGGLARLLLSAAVLLSFAACTVKHAPVPDGVVPKVNKMRLKDEEYGHKLFIALSKSYEVQKEGRRCEQLTAVVDHLTGVADADRSPWHVCLFNKPDIADVRAVHGNYVFVWSGLFDAAENEDEIASLLAHEIAHVLARHTDPVAFNVWSEIFFETASLAASIALLQLSQGILAINGSDWLKYAYSEAADLGPLDRKYSEDHEREATAIALLILARSRYSPEAMLDFWKRVQRSPGLETKLKPLIRRVAPQERVALLEELLPKLSRWCRGEQRSEKTPQARPLGRTRSLTSGI
jgi:predicted Zn-dependent protease